MPPLLLSSWPRWKSVPQSIHKRSQSRVETVGCSFRYLIHFISVASATSAQHLTSPGPDETGVQYLILGLPTTESKKTGQSLSGTLFDAKISESRGGSVTHVDHTKPSQWQFSAQTIRGASASTWKLVTSWEY